MKGLLQNSFRNRIFSMMLAAVMLIVVLSNLILINIYIANSNEKIMRRNEEQMNQAQQIFDNTLRSFEVLAKQFEKSSVTKAVLFSENKDSRVLHQNLFQYTQEWRDVAQFHIFNKGGICEYTTDSQKLDRTMDLTWGPLYLAAQSNEMVILSDGSDNPRNDENGLVCAYAMRSIKGNILGYFVITMGRSDFDILFHDLYDSNFGSLYLLDSFWRIVYAPNSAHSRQTVSNLRTQFLRGESLCGEDDANRYYVFHAEKIGFYFVLEQSNLYNSSVMETNRLVMLQMCIIGLPICLVCAWLLSRHFSKPVAQLDHAMKEIENGNYEATLEIRSKDEFERLAVGFNKMASQYRQHLLHQQELNRAQLRMLQAQLNPHFLYNTLDTIKWLGVTHKVPIIVKLTTSLASILRTSISAPAQVLLDDEMDILEHYINIQCIRFENKFSYEMDIDPNCFDCIVPKLILQPLVENSILHGLNNCDEGYIKVSAFEKNGCLIIRVYDNGCGLPEDILEWLCSEDKSKLPDHMGLYNVNEIITLQYGKDYGLSYVPGFSEGTCLQLTFPVLRSNTSEMI